MSLLTRMTFMSFMSGMTCMTAQSTELCALTLTLTLARGVTLPQP